MFRWGEAGIIPTGLLLVCPASAAWHRGGIPLDRGPTARSAGRPTDGQHCVPSLPAAGAGEDKAAFLSRIGYHLLSGAEKAAIQFRRPRIDTVASRREENRRPEKGRPRTPMKLALASVYALHALAYVAGRKHDRPSASHHIAQAKGLPERFLLKVL